MASARRDSADKTGDRPAERAKPTTRAAREDAMALMERVVHLRLQIRETCAKLGDNMEGALMRLTEHAGSVQPAAKRRAFLRRAAGEIEGLDIKPHRGRLRDIKRIDALLADLAKDLNALK